MMRKLKLHQVAFVLAVPVGLLCALAGVLAGDLDRKRIDADQRNAVVTELSLVRARFDGIVEAVSNLTVGFSNALESQDGSPDPLLLDRLARKTILVNQHIRSINLAPNDVISWVYPKEGNNTAAIGLKLAEKHGESEDVFKARRMRAPVLAGPIDLVEGGKAFIFRSPIYLKDDTVYFGALNVVTHIDSIMLASGIGDGATMRVALRKPDGVVVGGDAGVFDQAPVLSDVHIPGSTWQLGAVPISGWSRAAAGESRAPYLGAFAGIVLSGVMVLLGMALRRGYLKNVALNQEIEARQAIEDRLQLAATVFSSSGEAVIVMDSDFQVLSVNPAFSEISGFTQAEVQGRVPLFLDQAANAESRPLGVVAALKHTGKWRGEIVNQRKNGEGYPAWVTINSVESGNGTPGRYVAVCSDISMIQQSQQELDRIAHYDVLTALPNRLLFRKRLGQDIASVDSRGFVALMLLDVDGFKGVNDSFGHHVGDRLLREIGNRLLRCLGNRDTAARLGGDEFAAVFTGLSGRDEVVSVASKILNELQAPFQVDEVVVHLTVSIGIACCPDDGQDEVVLTRNADAAMYAAKEGGRNTFRFYQWEMTRAVRDALLMEQRMRLGLDQGQFEVWFQPQVSMATGRVIGAEGLVRWRDPEHGMISPAQFVPLAERSELVHKLGDVVIRQVLGHAQRWQTSGLEFGKLSINVATPQIERGDLVASLRHFLRDTEVPASALEIEVTESLFMTDAARARDTLNEIRALGLSIAIDDFGTGYSSLAYLKTLPINHLKIDRAFIKDLPSAKNDEAIVRAIISMGRSLGFHITAEGVETQEQLDFLKQEGCDVIQGYFFYKPMHAQDFERLLCESVQVPADVGS